MLSRQADSPAVYQYLYSHQGYLSLYDLISSKPWQLGLKLIAMKLCLPWFRSDDGVCHGDELLLMFQGQQISIF